METRPNHPEVSTGTLSTLAFVSHEEEWLSRTWSAQDQADHEHAVRRCGEELADVRQRLEALRITTGLLWERLLTLALERIRTGGLGALLEDTSLELHGLDQRLAETECALDRLRVSLHQRRQRLAEKIASINPLTQRSSLQEHINLMVERVDQLENHLAALRQPVAKSGDLPATDAASEALMYLRVRLLTTRLDILAADLSRQLGARDAELTALWPDLERLRMDLAALLARISTLQELTRYWLAYLAVVSTSPEGAPFDSDDAPPLSG